MDDKDKVAKYLEIYKLELERFYKSRDIEWKVNFSFWTLIVASGAFLIKHNVNCSNYWVIFLLIPLHFLWLRLIQESQESIQQNLKSYQTKIDTILSGEKKEPVPAKCGWGWILSATASSFILILIILTFK